MKKQKKNLKQKKTEIEIVNSHDDKGYFASWLMYGFTVDEYNQIIELLYGSSDKEKVN